MRIVTLGVSALMLSACAHYNIDRDDLALDQPAEVVFPIYHPEGVETAATRVALLNQPDVVAMARALGARRGTMVDWGLRCRVDAQWHLADCRVAGITPEFAGVSARIPPFLNGLPIGRTDGDVAPDQLEFRGRFVLRNAVPAPEWYEPCYSYVFCPVLHTLERNPPPPPPPPPPAATPPQGR